MQRQTMRRRICFHTAIYFQKRDGGGRSRLLSSSLLIEGYIVSCSVGRPFRRRDDGTTEVPHTPLHAEIDVGWDDADGTGICL